jgi:hypothetical protein
MKQIQNYQKSKGKSIPAYGFVKSQEEKKLWSEKKSSDFCRIFVISNKNSIGQGTDLKSDRKSTIFFLCDFHFSLANLRVYHS